MSLWSLFNENDGKTVFKWTHYLPVYELHFNRYVNRPLNILEIGCLHGGSLQMWKKYFGPHANIVAIDIDDNAKAHEEDQVSIRIGDQSDIKFLQSVVDEFGEFDIVIDDGSHVCNHQVESFKFLYPYVKDNGIYVVEDLHTNYWPEYGGGINNKGTFIELSKGLIDELNAYHTRGIIDVNEFTNSTYSINFYDSMIVFEKGRLLRRHDIIVGKDANGNRCWQEKQSIPYKITR